MNKQINCLSILLMLRSIRCTKLFSPLMIQMTLQPACSNLHRAFITQGHSLIPRLQVTFILLHLLHGGVDRVVSYGKYEMDVRPVSFVEFPRSAAEGILNHAIDPPDDLETEDIISQSFLKNLNDPKGWIEPMETPP